MKEFLFFYFAGMIIFSSVAAITLRSMVHSAVSLLITLIHVAGIYLILNAEFIAAIQIIVYAGSILVLYLFVVMLFNIKKKERFLHGQYPIAIIIGVFLMILMGSAIYISNPTGSEGQLSTEMAVSNGNTEVIGKALFTDYLIPFEIASFILLIAMVGSIILAKKEEIT